MSFTPSNPIVSSTWLVNNTANTSTWSADAEVTVFDMLADIDGNIIVAPDSTTINLFGGYTTDVPSVAGSWSADSVASSSWTPEG